MKKIRTIAISIALCCTPFTAAFAQTAPEASANAAPNAAVKSPQPVETDALAKGKTSFTKREAHSRLKQAGYSHISGLMKNSDGIWQAQATKGGQTLGVSLDYKGNISAQ